MAKKVESIKATAKHIKQHMSNMQGTAQINVLRHNHTSLPTKKKKGSKKPNLSKVTKPQLLQQKQSNQHMIEIQISVPDMVIPHMHQDLIAWQRSTNVNIAQKLDTSLKCALPKMHTYIHSIIIKVSQKRHIKSLYLNNPLINTRIHTNVMKIMTS